MSRKEQWESSSISSSGTASNARITKLGLQLGIIGALHSTAATAAKLSGSRGKHSTEQENLRKRQMKRKADTTALRRKIQQERTVTMQKVGGDLLDINSRLSVFDNLLDNHPSPSPSPAGCCSSSSSSSSSTATGTTSCERLRVTSPHRARHVASIFTSPHLGTPAPGHGCAKLFRLQVNFWTEAELTRSQPYTLADDPATYGVSPTFLTMAVHESCTPHDVLRTILQCWRWDDSYSFRFSGPGSGHTGKRVYEAAAFASDTKAPQLAEFSFSVGSKFLLEYDLDGDAWHWEGTCVGIVADTRGEIEKTFEEKNAKKSGGPLELEQTGKPQVLNQQGHLPLQYLTQFQNQYCRDGKNDAKGGSWRDIFLSRFKAFEEEGQGQGWEMRRTGAQAQADASADAGLQHQARLSANKQAKKPLFY